MRKLDNQKNIVIAVLLAAIGVMLIGIINFWRACNLRAYAISNDCTWVYQGTMYGDDRDYVRK